MTSRTEAVILLEIECIPEGEKISFSNSAKMSAKLKIYLRVSKEQKIFIQHSCQSTNLRYREDTC